MNLRNFGIIEGRLTKEPVIFENSDGSRKIMLTVAAADNFKKADGTRGTQFVNLEAFVPAARGGDLGAYAYMHKGDMVGLHYEVRTNNFTKADGTVEYGQVLQVQSVDLKETKKSVEARAAATDEVEAAE